VFLSNFPRAAPERPELGRSSRMHPYKSHVIVYRLDGPDIFIQRVRHGREDWMSQL
jgi:toxin ParE1/3/4